MAEYVEPTPDILANIAIELRDKVESGEILVSSPETWHSPDKPVLRDAVTHRLTKGSGRIKGSKDIAIASKETAFQRRKGYRHLIEEYIPPSDLKDTPNAIISFRELIDNLVDACSGSPQMVSCQHEGCSEKHLVAFKKDPNVLFKLYENLAGKAKETSEMSINSTHLAISLNERTPIDGINVRSLDRDIIEARFKEVKEAE